MSTPGVSLFQGGDSIKMNSSLERAAEEEELEDQRRRNEEIGNLLQNAFDDLEEEEDTTVDSTTNFHSDETDNGHQQPALHPNVDHRNVHAYEAEIDQMKMLLESRKRELDNVKKIAHDEYKKRDELQKRLTIAEAELDRALAGKKNTHELLVESKEKCSNFENVIAKVRNEKKALEAENNTLLGKLETAQTLLADVQQKYDMVERDFQKQNDRNSELRRKHMEERHRAELEMLQQQLEQLTNKLEKKVSELESMSTRYNALQNSHEVMLVDKATRINELNSALMQSQRKCEELLNRKDYFNENIRLQNMVASLQDKTKAMEGTIAQLKERLEFTTTELDLMDSVLQQHNLEDSVIRLSPTHGKVVNSTPLNTVDRLGNLKSELMRALANVKCKRDEIRKLQQSLEDKNSEIRALKELENESLVQISTLKEDRLRLENRIKVLEEEYQELLGKTVNKTLNNSKIQVLTSELNDLKADKMRLEREKHDMEEERHQHEFERKKLDLQLKNIEVDLEELKQEYESMKLNYEQTIKENHNLRNRTTADNVRLELEKHKFLLKDALAECDRLKKLYVDISNEKEALTYELDKLRNEDKMKELQEQRDKVANLQRTLQLTEVKASELAKILETERLCHEREVNTLKEKIEKGRASNMKAIKESSNNCTKCMDYMADITKLEIDNLKLSNVISGGKKEIDNLNQKLREADNVIGNLTDKLKLSDQQENLIKELKSKAQQFEEYIKTQSSASDKSTGSPKQNTSSEKSVNTSPELQKAEVKKIETRIRDEMAKIFAIELKRFQMKTNQTEEKLQSLQREHEQVNVELQERQHEVDLLKRAILAEREQVGKLLHAKEGACQQIIQSQNALLTKCRTELKAKSQKLLELTKELADRQTQIEAERQSMKAVMTQWEQQRQTVDEVENEWKDKLTQVKKIHESALESWQVKYNSAKRTIVNYKRYAEDKEAHMLKEYERLKYEYNESITKIEVRMKEVLEKKAWDVCKVCKLKESKKSTDKNFPSNCDKENQAKN